MTALQRLHFLTNRILDTPADAFGELFTGCDDLYQFLAEINNLDTDQQQNRDELLLDSGKAIGPTWAAMCIKDFMRTKKFVDGVFEATSNLSANRYKRPIHIVYAGTGPFATLVLPLFARFPPDQVQCTLIEINANSFAYLQKLITILELQPYIRRIEKTDATSWNLPEDELTDIFISETMNLGLTKEPQVAIYMNIIPQLQKETIIIPQQVKLEAALIHPGKRQQYKMGELQKDVSTRILSTVFELNRSTVNEAAFTKTGELYIFRESTLSIPAGKQDTELCILTTITVHDTTRLLPDESAITMPLKLRAIEDSPAFQLSLWYETGPQPGIHFREL